MGQLTNILLDLTDGKTPVVKFPDSEEMERFRQAIYKEKKLFDETQQTLDPFYEVQSLKFFRLGESKVRLSFFTPVRTVLNFEVEADGVIGGS